MRKLFFIAVMTAAVVAASGANACGPNTLELLKQVATMQAAPAYRCGSAFNAFLHAFHAKDYPGALAAYEAHLKGLGKPFAGTPDAEATLAYLRKLAGK